MAVDNSAINFDNAVQSFSPSPSTSTTSLAAPLLQLGDGALSKSQVRDIFAGLLQTAAFESPGSPVGDTSTVDTSLSRLVSRILNEGMNGAEDGDVTGRELKFMVLCGMLSTFMRIQNPSILSNIGQCVEQAICTLAPTPSSTGSLFETLLHAFLHSIKLAKISAMYTTRRNLVKAVVYIPATNPPLVSDLVALPDVTFRHCPLHEVTHRMHTLTSVVEEDVAAGLLPVMVHTVVGMSPHSFCDDIPGLVQLCKKHDMVLSLDGPGLAMLLSNDPITEPIVAAIKDPELKLSLTLPLHHLLMELPLDCWMVFAHLPVLSSALEAVPPIPNPATLVALYLYLSTTTAKKLRNHIQVRDDQARYLHQVLKNTPCVEILTAPDNVYTIKWRYRDPEAEAGPEQDLQQLHRLLCRHWEGICPRSKAVGIHEKYFAYVLLAHKLPRDLADKMAGLFAACSKLQRSIRSFRPSMDMGIVSEEQLVLLSPPSNSPFVLSTFRFVPSFYKGMTELTEEQVAELNLINEKMGRILRQRDPVFQSLVVEGRVVTCVAADPNTFTPVFDEPYVQELLKQIRDVMEQLEKDDEVMMMIRAEVTKKGIEEAEQMLRRLQEDEAAQESVLRVIPIVRTLTNWWYPLDRPQLKPIRFDLRTTKVSLGEFSS